MRGLLFCLASDVGNGKWKVERQPAFHFPLSTFRQLPTMHYQPLFPCNFFPPTPVLHFSHDYAY